MAVKLKALKQHRYGGKSMHAGQIYEAAERDARVLTGARLAVIAPAETRKVIDPRKDLVKRADISSLARLRGTYESMSGESADRRWGEARLVREIGELGRLQEKERDAGDSEADYGD